MRKAGLYFWGARALYLGPAFGLSAHRNAVAVLCAGAAGPFEVACDPRKPAAGYVACRTALIPPNTLHHLHSGDRPMAFLYLDALSTDYAMLRRAMARVERCVAFELSDAAGYLDALAELRAERAWDEVRPRIEAALGLHAPAGKDARIADAIRALHKEPAAGGGLARFATRANLSPSRFLHLFAQETGLPFRRYRLWARMGAAVRTMLAGESLTASAYAAGFSSSAHFSAAFREMFGMAPSALARFNLDPAVEGVW